MVEVEKSGASPPYQHDVPKKSKKPQQENKYDQHQQQQKTGRRSPNWSRSAIRSSNSRWSYMSRCSRTLNRRSNSVKTGQGGDGLTRYASLKREREDEEKVSKKERRVGGGRTEKALDRTKFLFVPNQNI